MSKKCNNFVLLHSWQTLGVTAQNKSFDKKSTFGKFEKLK